MEYWNDFSLSVLLMNRFRLLGIWTYSLLHRKAGDQSDLREPAVPVRKSIHMSAERRVRKVKPKSRFGARKESSDNI